MDNDRDLADPVMNSSGISVERKRRDDEAAWFNELWLRLRAGLCDWAPDGRDRTGSDCAGRRHPPAPHHAVNLSKRQTPNAKR